MLWALKGYLLKNLKEWIYFLAAQLNNVLQKGL